MRIRLRLTLACCFLWFAAPCFGCTCGMSPPSKAKIETERESMARLVDSENAKSFIFEGVVEQQKLVQGNPGVPEGTMSMTTSGQHRIVTIRVLRMYRGPSRERYTVRTGFGNGDCGFDFETGKAYLIFADTGGDGSLVTSICTPTKPLEAASPALLRYLQNEPASAEDSLDPEAYNKNYAPRWYGSVCGKVVGPDGSPLWKARVDVWQVRDDPFPPYWVSASDLSQSDGSYCIEMIRPGTYILTAEKENFTAGNRAMGYYPSVYRHSEAVHIEVTAGSAQKLPSFQLHEESLYDIRIRAVTPEGTPPPAGGMFVAIRATEQDGLSYRIGSYLEENGARTFGFIPAGKYIVTCAFAPELNSEKFSKNIAMWLPSVEQNVLVTGNTEVVLKLIPKN